MLNEERYTTEVRPVVFRMLNAAELYLSTIGIDKKEIQRAIADWLNYKRMGEWRRRRET